MERKTICEGISNVSPVLSVCDLGSNADISDVRSSVVVPTLLLSAEAGMNCFGDKQKSSDQDLDADSRGVAEPLAKTSIRRRGALGSSFKFCGISD